VFTYGLNLLFAIIVSLVLKLLVEAYMASFSSYTLMKFKNYINTGTSSLMVNSAASLGAGVIAIVSGLVMDAFGWSNYYLFLAILCAISVAICGIGSIIIKKKSNISTWL
jgi:sugar phosphate permease